MGDFTTDSYILPFINRIYRQQATQLEANTDSSFDEFVRDVPALPIGTTSLQNYQAKAMANEDGSTSTGPLYGLATPITVEWKQVGQPDSEYVEADRTGKLPNVSPAAPSPPYIMQWEWRGGVIYLTPLGYPCDMRVRGEYPFGFLLKDSDELGIHPTMDVPVGYGASALIGQERNNASYAAGYKEQADQTLEDIENILVKAEQGTVTRIGRLGNTNVGGYGNGGTFG